MKEKILSLNLYFGLTLFVFSSALLALEVLFMKTWFYCFAWWSFILVVDSLNFRRKKRSPLSESPKRFFHMAFLSVLVWLVFELFNLRLKNWSYHDLPSNLLERWSGYFIAYASVIPALREMSFFIEGFFENKKLSLFQVRITPFLLKLLVAIGWLFLFLSLCWPGLFFPLVWLCFFFLLEPLNFRLKNETLLEHQERGDWKMIWSWIAAGLTAGIFWELWNFWAGSHWEYNLPYLDFWRVFQMPVFGYTGFMPFALEIFAFDQLFSGLCKKLEERKRLKNFIFSFLTLFYLGCFYLIDVFTLVR